MNTHTRRMGKRSPLGVLMLDTGTPGSARRQEARQQRHPRPRQEVKAAASTGPPPDVPPRGSEHNRSPPSQGYLFSADTVIRFRPI